MNVHKVIVLSLLLLALGTQSASAQSACRTDGFRERFNKAASYHGKHFILPKGMCAGNSCVYEMGWTGAAMLNKDPRNKRKIKSLIFFTLRKGGRGARDLSTNWLNILLHTLVPKMKHATSQEISRSIKSEIEAVAVGQKTAFAVQSPEVRIKYVRGVPSLAEHGLLITCK